MPAALLRPAPDASTVVRGRPRDLAWFYVLTFGITWGIAAALLVARPQVEALVGTFSTRNPLYVLAVCSPSLAAIVLTVVRGGAAALVDLVCRACRWRVSWRWYAVVLLGWPAMDYLARLLQWAVTGERVSLVPVETLPAFDGLPWVVLPSLLVSTLLLDAGPLGEGSGSAGTCCRGCSRAALRWSPPSGSAWSGASGTCRRSSSPGPRSTTAASASAGWSSARR